MSGAARALHCRKQRALKPFLKRMGNPSKVLRAWDRDLQFSLLNEEFPVSASHQLALITSLPFVHTARRYYRLGKFQKSQDLRLFGFTALLLRRMGLMIFF